MDEVGELIAESRDAFAGAVARGDAPAAASMYAEDASLLPPAADLLRGRAAIERFWQAGIDAGVAAIHLEPEILHADADVAVDIGRYEMRLESERADWVTDRGRYLAVLRRAAEGTWRRVVEVLTPDAHSPNDEGDAMHRHS